LTAKRSTKRAAASSRSFSLYSLVGVAFLWETVGGVVDAPSWALGLSPFHHVGLVPAEAFDATGAVVMLAIGALASIAAAWAFDRRDVLGA
jgi:polyether ionophore transport system permease protein